MPLVTASSFADPKDVVAFKKCKAHGKTDNECFKVGDNGIGLWGDNTAQEHTPMVALPPDDMIWKWGSINGAKRKKVYVYRPDSKVGVLCIVGDRMPYRKNIKNGCLIDLNPATLKQLGWKAPIKRQVIWNWA